MEKVNLFLAKGPQALCNHTNPKYMLRPEIAKEVSKDGAPNPRRSYGLGCRVCL